MSFKGYAQKELLIQVRADIYKATLELQKVSAEIKKTGKSAGDTGKPLKSMEQNFNLLRNAAGGYLSLQLAKKILLEADSYNILQDRIRSATKQTGDYENVSRKVYELSQANGAGLKSSVDLFQSIGRAREDLGATNTQILQLVDTVEKLGVIGGSSGAALDGAILQFSQMMGGSIVQAQEFNSIMDGMPELTNRLARSMGLTVGGLKQSVNTGTVLAKDVFQKLLSISDQVNADFQELPDRVSRTSTSLSNSLDRFLSQLDHAASGTGTLAAIMRGITHSLDNWSNRLAETQLDELMRKRTSAAIRYTAMINAGVGAQSRAVREVLQLINQLDDKIKAANLAIIKANNSSPAPPSGNTPPTQSLSNKAASDAIEKNIKNLEAESASYGDSERAAALYKLQLQGATQAQLMRADAALKSIEVDKDFDASVKQSEEAIKKENAAYNEWLKTLSAEGVNVYTQTRTDSEKLSAQWERFDALLAAGAIDWDTYSRAVFNAQDAFDNVKKTGTSTMDELIAATKGWGDQFTNTLADMVQNGKANFSDLSKSIIHDLLRIMIYQEITKPILGYFGVKGFADGGLISGAGTGTSDSIPARVSNGEYIQPARAVNHYGAGFMEQVRTLQLPKFATGGLVRFHRPAAAHFASGGMVDGQGLPGSGGNVTVQIENKSSSPVKATSTRTKLDVSGMVVNVVLDDISKGGPIAHKLTSTYGMTRKPK